MSRRNLPEYISDGFFYLSHRTHLRLFLSLAEYFATKTGSDSSYEAETIRFIGDQKIPEGNTEHIQE